MEQRGRAAEEYQSSQEENYNKIIKTFDQYCELFLKINNDNNNIDVFYVLGNILNSVKVL